MPADPASEPTRILFVIGTLDVGGAERQLVEIATHLSGRFAPSVCCLSSPGPLREELDRAGVPVRVVGLRGIRQARGLEFLLALLRFPIDVVRFVAYVRRVRPAILHGFLFHAYILGGFAARLTGVPVLVTSRRSLSHFKRQRAAYRVAERAVNRWTLRVIANSDAVRQDTIETEGLDEGHVSVIYNGLDPDRFGGGGKEAARRTLGLGAGPVVLVVANLIAYKGHTHFLRAWAGVCKTYPDAVALLVGEGPVRPALEAEAASLGIRDRVRFLGTRQDVPTLLEAADLLAHPSLEEGFCNAIIEAMAASRPVVATDVGGNVEAVVDGETGLLVPARDAEALAGAILDILGRPDRGESLGRAGRARVVERFTRSRMVAEYEATYEELLAGRRP